MEIGRRVIFTSVGTVIPAANSADFGNFPVARYPRISGFCRVDSVASGTANLQFRNIVGSTVMATSALLVVSGGIEFNFPQNFPVMGIGITPVTSLTAYSVVVFGESQR